MHWFKSFGLLYRPVSLAGWLITALVLAFCVQTFLAIDRNSHSVTDTLYGIFPYWAPSFLFWAWIAGRTSRTDQIGLG